MKRTCAVVALSAVFLFSTHAAWAGKTVASFAKKGALVGFAKANLASGTVLASGGKGTTSVSVESFGPGAILLRFTGTYPTDIAADDVVVQSSSESGEYGVTNVQVSSVSPTQIEVAVYNFKSSTEGDLSDSVFVSLRIGA